MKEKKWEILSKLKVKSEKLKMRREERAVAITQ
jgi:hypothetical protein